MGGSGFRASPSCFMCGSLAPSTSQARGNASQQFHSQQEGTLCLLNPAPNMKTLVTWKQPSKSLVIPKEEVLFLSSAWKPCPESTCGQISYNPTHLSRFSSEVTLEWPCSGNQNVPKRSSGENQAAQGRAYQHGAKTRAPTCAALPVTHHVGVGRASSPSAVKWGYDRCRPHRAAIQIITIM